MGTLRLLVPESIAADRRVISTIHMIRFDSMPWPCRVVVEQSLVSLHRLVHHSGQVCLAYPIEPYGELALRTGTLPERESPYSLPVELARGTLDRLRNQLEMWRDSGLRVPAEIDQWAGEATSALADAVLLGEEFSRQTALANSSLRLTLDALFELCRQFSGQVAAMRRDEVEPSTKLGVRALPSQLPADWLKQLGPDFHVICVSPEPKAKDNSGKSLLASVIAAAEAADSRREFVVGPIWDAGLNGLPDHVNDITHFDSKRMAAREHFVKLFGQIESQPDWLYAASGLNGIGHKFLSYPQQMQLVVDLLQTIEEFNRQVPVMISFDHPWSERLAWSVGGSQGLQIADILLRHDVRLSGLGLEINLDYWPFGSLPRDPLQWLELIDIWAQFGLPLFLMIRIPTGPLLSGLEAERNGPIRNSFAGQQKWNYVQSVLAVALSRPFVHAVIWNEWRDEPNQVFPLSGLFDAHNRPKPILSLLTSIYRQLESAARPGR